MSVDDSGRLEGPGTARRLARAASALSALIVLGIVTGAASSFYLAASVWRDIGAERHVGSPTALDHALIAVPLVIQVLLYAVVITVGLRLRGRLRAGEEHARRGVFHLSGWCAAGLVVAFAATGIVLETANPGDGASIRPALLAESLTAGGLNALGWLGMATAAALVVLFAGAVAMAVLTRESGGAGARAGLPLVAVR